MKLFVRSQSVRILGAHGPLFLMLCFVWNASRSVKSSHNSRNGKKLNWHCIIEISSVATGTEHIANTDSKDNFNSVLGALR